jgi:hypothetical protein
VRALVIAAVASAALAASVGSAFAQDVVPIRPNFRGEASCPSNYVIRGNACVSIYAGRGGGYDPGYQQRPQYRDDRFRYEQRGDYDHRGRHVVEPRVNRRGELQCPSNYVIRRGMCVSVY